EPAAAATADGVDLIQEDDAGGGFLRLLEEVANAGGAHADEHFDKVGTADREERHIRLAGDRLGKQRLAAPWRAGEEHAAGNASAEAHELLGVLEELDDLLDLVLGLIDAGDVLEGDAVHLLGQHAVARLAETAEHAAAARRGAA